jgi:hypothetical protein
MRQWLSATLPPLCARRNRRFQSWKRPNYTLLWESAEKDEEIVTRGMRFLQSGHAWAWLALHMQHAYLAAGKGIGPYFVQREKR